MRTLHAPVICSTQSYTINWQ